VYQSALLAPDMHTLLHTLLHNISCISALLHCCDGDPSTPELTFAACGLHQEAKASWKDTAACMSLSSAHTHG